METLKQLIKEAADQYGSRPAFMVREKSRFEPVTYLQLKEETEMLAVGMLKIGLKEKHIAVIGKNSYLWILSFLAITGDVGICVSLDAQLSQEELENLTKRGEADAVIYSEETESKILELKEKIPGLILISMGKSEASDYSIKELMELGKVGAGSVKGKELIPEEFRILLFTSGTLGNAKGVMLSHKNICSNIMDELDRVDAPPGTRVLSYLPIHHIYEMSFGILRALYQGAVIYFSRGGRHLFADLKEIRPEFFSAVPAIVENFYRTASSKAGEDREETQKVFLEMFGGKLRILVSGAAPLNKQVHCAMRDMPFCFLSGYGLTETSPVISVDDGETVPGSCGKLLDGIQARIEGADEDGTGELWVKGPNVMLGYYRDEAATMECLKDGWFHTGDTGYLRGQQLFLKGRRKNVIVLANGKKVSPEEVEQKLSEIPEVHTCLCRLSEDKRGLEAEIYPVPELFKQHENDRSAIFEILQERIQEFNKDQVYYKRIVSIRLRMVDFERTTTKKVKRGQLYERRTETD